MPQFYKDQVFLIDLLKASSLKQRLLGLIPYKKGLQKQAFWISYCSSVHTFFMKFPLDVFFTNKDFKILKIFENVGPNRILFGGFKSRHVFECQQGQMTQLKLKKGDQLHVES